MHDWSPRDTLTLHSHRLSTMNSIHSVAVTCRPIQRTTFLLWQAAEGEHEVCMSKWQKIVVTHPRSRGFVSLLLHCARGMAVHNKLATVDSRPDDGGAAFVCTRWGWEVRWFEVKWMQSFHLWRGMRDRLIYRKLGMMLSLWNLWIWKRIDSTHRILRFDSARWFGDRNNIFDAFLGTSTN